MLKTAIFILVIFFISKTYITKKFDNIINTFEDKIKSLELDLEKFQNNTTKSLDPNNVSKCKKRETIKLPPKIRKNKKVKIDPIVQVKCDSQYSGYNNESNCYNYLKLN